eukprot:scaffold109293_cov14-Tisochrysis_lutea.AAC.1
MKTEALNNWSHLTPSQQQRKSFGGAGGSTTWEALLRADSVWSQLRNKQVSGCVVAHAYALNSSLRQTKQLGNAQKPETTSNDLLSWVSCPSACNKELETVESNDGAAQNG